MPGVIRLADELGVSKRSVEQALRELEGDGLLRNQGKGRGRVIDLAGGRGAQRRLRLAILLYELADRSSIDTLELLHELREKGHTAFLAARTMGDLGHNVERVARLVRATEADGWVIFAGSRDILEWFAENQVTAFAYAGRANRVPLASIAPNKEMSFQTAIRRLVGLGHRRIVMMVREDRRKPEPGRMERFLLKELETLGINTGPYNLPEWEGSIKGFHAGMESLFRHTPPTAMILDEEPFVMATFQFCLANGLRVPEDLSLLCTDPGPAFAWCQPSIAHISWDHRPIVRRIVRWADSLRQGKRDLRKSYSKARFVEGGTIGPVPNGKKACALP
jgi:DNA-binding LacI/PurR family transcriptional regulator